VRYPGKDISGMCESQGSKMFLLPYVKTWGSGTRQPELESSLYHLLTVWPWANYGNFWASVFSLTKWGNNSNNFIELLWGLNEIRHLTHSEQFAYKSIQEMLILSVYTAIPTLPPALDLYTPTGMAQELNRCKFSNCQKDK